ncbi:hypothetical protein [Pseudomonas extremaustralis]|uniref:hypothetical protein n=1 Tax=Pseudomonas extremaustralis TaxID=359110 RepID=UPI00285BC4A3|nr:hypothetical protein [Pseudomonas extremaustralis]MDR6575873.1 hypothetical protein [Pseudomonas extremaustralis]
MKVVNPANLPVFADDHPTGALKQRYLFLGPDGSPENFMFSIAETTDRFAMVRHRHNFDQFRFALKGDMSMGGKRALREGHLGYFPEGTAYGPQDDQAGPVALVLQFGGASGYGYMSPDQYRRGRAELQEVGHFEGPVFVPNPEATGMRKAFSINAIWKQAMNAPLLIPAPRYDQSIFMNPKACRWIPQAAPGVFRKALGTFSDREVCAEMWQVDVDSELQLSAGKARRLLFVLNGEGSANNEALGQWFGIQIDAGESATIKGGKSQLTLLSFVIPPVVQQASAPQISSFEPVPGEAVPGEFELD